MKTKTNLGKSGGTRKILFSVLPRGGGGIFPNFVKFFLVSCQLPSTCIHLSPPLLLTFCTGIYQKLAHNSFHSVCGEDFPTF